MAAGKIFNKLLTVGNGMVQVNGSFRPKGTSAPVVVDGKRWSVVRTSVGLYTVTFGDKYVQLVEALAGARVADATGTLVQAGDFSAANKTLQIRTFRSGGSSSSTKQLPLSITALRLASRAKIVNLMSMGGLTLGSTPPTLNGTVGGFAFDADAETAYLHFRVPEDWDGVSNITLRLVWHPEAGTAIGDTETVIWKTTHGCIAAGEAVDNGTEVVTSTTYTQSGAGTDKAEIRTAVALAYDSGDQPISAGDTVYVMLQRDKTTDTYAADAVLTRVEVQYNTPLPLISAVEGVADGPYLARVNGATDPSFRVVWPAGDVTPVQFPALEWPPDVDGAADLTVSLKAGMSGAVDTPVIAVGAYEDVGDTNFGGNTAALAAAVAEKTVTLAAADFTGHPKTLNLLLTPGTHNTDAVYLYSAGLEYASLESDAFVLADLADDADNVINFSCTFRNSTVATP